MLVFTYVPFLPVVTLNPLPPIEELTPDLLTFRLMPGAILILFLKLAIL